MPAPAVPRAPKPPSGAVAAPLPPQPVAAAAPIAAQPMAQAAPAGRVPAAPVARVPVPPAAPARVAAPPPPPAVPSPVIIMDIGAHETQQAGDKATDATSKPFADSQVYMLSQHDEPTAFSVFNICCNLFMGACIGATAVLLAMFFFTDCRFVVSATQKPKETKAPTSVAPSARAGHDDMDATFTWTTDQDDLTTGDGTTMLTTRGPPPSKKKSQKSNTRKVVTRSRDHRTLTAAKAPAKKKATGRASRRASG